MSLCTKWLVVDEIIDDQETEENEVVLDSEDDYEDMAD